MLIRHDTQSAPVAVFYAYVILHMISILLQYKNALNRLTLGWEVPPALETHYPPYKSVRHV